LARSGIIEIVQGTRGGYRLLKSPDQISLLDVVEGIIGEVFFNDCTREHACCSMVSNCPVHPIWEKARSQFRETLSAVSFSVMMQNKITL
jgi:Rrf2 family protein